MWLMWVKKNPKQKSEAASLTDEKVRDVEIDREGWERKVLVERESERASVSAAATPGSGVINKMASHLLKASHGQVIFLFQCGNNRGGLAECAPRPANY